MLRLFGILCLLLGFLTGVLAEDRVQEIITELDSADHNLRREAARLLEGVRDQRAVEALVRALSDTDPDVRRRAARGLGTIKETRATEFLISALKDADPFVREAAAKALGQIKDSRAVEPLTAANLDIDSHVREAAARAWSEVTGNPVKIRETSSTYLTIHSQDCVTDRSMRTDGCLAAIAQLNDRGTLLQIAGNLERLTSSDDAGSNAKTWVEDRGTAKIYQSAARVRLAISEPAVVRRLPKLSLLTSYESTSASYHSSTGQSMPATGEQVTFSIRDGARTIASHKWETSYPSRLAYSGAFAPLKYSFSVRPDPQNILKKLFACPDFHQDDLLALLDSATPEVRSSAVANLAGQRRIAGVALNHSRGDVRQHTVRRMTDEQLLVKIAVESKDKEVLRIAAASIKDQAFLEKLAVEDGDPLVREVAVRQVNDRAVLARLVLKDENEGVRLVAASKIKDQALLGEIAQKDKSVRVRSSAINFLNDKVLLENIAANNAIEELRSAAKQRLHMIELFGDK